MFQVSKILAKQLTKDSGGKNYEMLECRYCKEFSELYMYDDDFEGDNESIYMCNCRDEDGE